MRKLGKVNNLYTCIIVSVSNKLIMCSTPENANGTPVERHCSTKTITVRKQMSVQ